MSNIPLFNTNDATSAQLRYSGGYRLIQKKGVADSLITYDQINKTLLLQAGYYTQYFNQLNGIWQESIDLTIRSDTSYFSKGRLTNKALPTIQMDEKARRIFNNKLFYFSGVLKNYNLMLQTLSDYAVRLLAYLQKQYKLEEEND